MSVGNATLGVVFLVVAVAAAGLFVLAPSVAQWIQVVGFRVAYGAAFVLAILAAIAFFRR